MGLIDRHTDEDQAAQSEGNKEAGGMTENQLEQLLKDYHWMSNSVKIIREGLNDIGDGLTAQYGAIRFIGSSHEEKNVGKSSMTMYEKSNLFQKECMLSR